MSNLKTSETSDYPGTLDTYTDFTDGETAIDATYDGFADAIINIETEVGLNPSGTLSNVKTFIQTGHNEDGTQVGGYVLFSQCTFLTSTFRYFSISGPNDSGNEANAQVAMPVGGVFRNMTAQATVTGLGGTITLRVNGVSSSLSLSVTASDTAVHDNATDVTVSKGDLVDFRIDASGTVDDSKVSICFISNGDTT